MTDAGTADPNEIPIGEEDPGDASPGRGRDPGDAPFHARPAQCVHRGRPALEPVPASDGRRGLYPALHPGARGSGLPQPQEQRHRMGQALPQQPPQSPAPGHRDDPRRAGVRHRLPGRRRRRRDRKHSRDADDGSRPGRRGRRRRCARCRALPDPGPARLLCGFGPATEFQPASTRPTCRCPFAAAALRSIRATSSSATPTGWSWCSAISRRNSRRNA